MDEASSLTIGARQCSREDSRFIIYRLTGYSVVHAVLQDSIRGLLLSTAAVAVSISVIVMVATSSIVVMIGAPVPVTISSWWTSTIRPVTTSVPVRISPWTLTISSITVAVALGTSTV
ncbi:hypothetical protein BDW68DRAFT_126887 [Aspergillus falconensis]